MVFREHCASERTTPALEWKLARSAVDGVGFRIGGNTLFYGGAVYAVTDGTAFVDFKLSEKWQLETGLAPLVEACGKLLAERSFLVLSSYAVGTTALAFWNLLDELEGGAVEAGELALVEEGEGGRRLPCGFSARWSRGL